MTTSSQQRNLLIDATKGIGILLVAVGHAIQTNVPDFDHNLFFRLIYSFHMPLFMFLSGCVAKYGDVKSITKNVVRLVLPFICWYLVTYGMKYFQEPHISNFYDYIMQLIKSPDYGLWFLWVLFLCHICFYFMSQLQAKLGIIAAVITFFAVQYIPVNYLGVGLLKMHFPFFVLGYLAMKYQNKIAEYRYVLMMLACAIFVVLFPMWQRGNNEALFQVAGSISQSLLHVQGYLAKTYYYTIAIAGIGTTVSVIYFVMKLNKARVFLTTLGLYTLDIYVSHQLFLGYGVTDNMTIKVITCFIVAILASLILAFILKKIPVIKTMLYGITDKKLKQELKVAA